MTKKEKERKALEESWEDSLKRVRNFIAHAKKEDYVSCNRDSQYYLACPYGGCKYEGMCKKEDYNKCTAPQSMFLSKKH